MSERINYYDILIEASIPPISLMERQVDMLRRVSLRGLGVNLKPFIDWDNQKLARYYEKWFNNEELRRYLYPTTPRTLEPITEWIDEVKQNSRSAYWTITPDGMDRPIGHLGAQMKLLEGIGIESGLSYLNGETKLHRKGYIKAAVGCYIGYLDKCGMVRKLQTWVVDGNEASNAILESFYPEPRIFLNSNRTNYTFYF